MIWKWTFVIATLITVSTQECAEEWREFCKICVARRVNRIVQTAERSKKIKRKQGAYAARAAAQAGTASCSARARGRTGHSRWWRASPTELCRTWASPRGTQRAPSHDLPLQRVTTHKQSFWIQALHKLPEYSLRRCKSYTYVSKNFMVKVSKNWCNCNWISAASVIIENLCVLHF